MMKNLKAVYPGTFDPLTNGHLDILLKSSKLFDEVIVAVAKNASKSPLLGLEERCEMIEQCIFNCQNIKVLPFDELLVDFAMKQGVDVIIRGLRAVSDFEYEFQMGYANQSLNPSLETVFLMPNLNNTFVSSSIVRNILSYQGQISHLVPEVVVKILKQKGYECI